MFFRYSARFPKAAIDQQALHTTHAPRALSATAAGSDAARRLFSTIVAGAEEVCCQHKAHKREDAERAPLAARRVSQARSTGLGTGPVLAQRRDSGYDEAVAHLADLRDLAVHRGQRPAFDAWLAEVIAPYAGPAALQRCCTRRGWCKT